MLMPAVKLKSVFIDSWQHYDDQNSAIIPILRRRYGTRFTILVSGKERAEIAKEWCVAGDQIIDSSELIFQEKDNVLEDGDIYIKSRSYEQKYKVNYMRDIVMSDRRMSVYYGGYAPQSAFNSQPQPIRQTYSEINHWFKYFENLFDEWDFDLMIAQPFGIMLTPAVQVAISRKIPVTFPTGSRIGTLFNFWSDAYQGSRCLQKVYDALPDGPVDVVVPEAYPVRPDIAEKFSNAAKTSYLVKTIIRHLKIRLHFWLIDLLKWRKGRRLSLFSVIRASWYSWRLGRWMAGNCNSSFDDVVSQPYVLYLLQTEPEFFSMCISKEFNNTEAIIRQLAVSIPAGMRLVIKEHPTNIGNRAIHFYRELMKLPNLVLADTAISGIALAQHAELVCTMAGTVGNEASELGKPVLAFSLHTNYDFLPNVTVVRDITRLAETIAEILERHDATAVEATRIAAARYRQAVIARSYDVPNSKERGLSGEMTPDLAELAADRLVETLLSQLEELHGAPVPEPQPA